MSYFVIFFSRYFLPEVEANSDNYLKNQVIAASESVQKLASDRLLTAKLWWNGYNSCYLFSSSFAWHPFCYALCTFSGFMTTWHQTLKEAVLSLAIMIRHCEVSAEAILTYCTVNLLHIGVNTKGIPEKTGIFPELGNG